MHDFNLKFKFANVTTLLMLYTTLRRRIMTRWFVLLWPSWIEMITKLCVGIKGIFSFLQSNKKHNKYVLCVGIKGIFSFLQSHKKYNKYVPRSSATPWLMESSGITICCCYRSRRSRIIRVDEIVIISQIIAVPSFVVLVIAALLGRSKSRLSVSSLWSKTINYCRTWYITVYFVDITLSLCRVCGKTYD